MMKSYAKKREAVHAAQWTGEMTPAMTALVGERKISVGSDRQLAFANEKGCGRFACVGDWIVSFSGEDLTVVGAEQFGNIYEEVDGSDSTMPSATVRIDYDDDQLNVVEKINTVLKTHDLVLVDDGLPHDGYCLFTLRKAAS